jgi:hypothetical protein
MPADFEILKYVSDFFEMPPPPQKEDWVKVYTDMAVHTRKRLPRELLLATRPNEEKHVFDYRLANYEAITYGSMNRALDSIFRMVAGVNYSINCPDDISAYINKRVFMRQTLEVYLQRVVLKRIIEDPNGLLVWLPKGPGLVDSAQKVQPTPELIYSDQIVDIQDDVVAYKSREKSTIKNARKEVKEGDVYIILTKTAVYKMVQVGTKSRKEFELFVVYEHNIGEVPAIILGGDMNAEGFNESFFAPYLACGNQAIRQFSDWQAIMVNTAFPYTEEFYLDAEFNNFENQSNPAANDTEDEFSGERKIEARESLKPMPKTPYGVRMRRVPAANQTLGDNILPADIPSRRYIYPDTTVAEYSGKAWELLIDKAEQALHLNLGQANQSGVAKELDKEEHYAMITKVGNNFFDGIMLNSLRYIAAYYNMVEADRATELVSINKPAVFKIKTENDLTSEIGDLKSKNAPAMFVSEATSELARKRFNDPVTLRIFQIIERNDPLYIYSTSEKNGMVMSNTATREQVVKSIHIYSILQRLAQDMTAEKFMDASEQEIIAKFEEAVALVIPPSPANVYDPSGNAQ